jgi:hypothetical protein
MELPPQSKICCRCKEEKLITEFHVDRSTPSGLSYSCVTCRRKQSLDYRRKNHELVCQRDREHQKRNWPKIKERRKEYIAYNRQRIRVRAQQRLRELWRVAYAVYGGRCDCCGETRIEMMTLDHVFNDGAYHREVNKDYARKILCRIEKSGRPEPGIAMRCYNCNCVRLRCGECPHVTERKVLLERIRSCVTGADFTALSSGPAGL